MSDEADYEISPEAWERVVRGIRDIEQMKAEKTASAENPLFRGSELLAIEVTDDEAADGKWPGIIKEVTNPDAVVDPVWQTLQDEAGVDVKVLVIPLPDGSLTAGKYWAVIVGQTEPAGNAIPKLVLCAIAGIAGSVTSDNAWHCVAGENWPDDLDDVFLRKVARDEFGTLGEVFPYVEIGRRPVLVDSGVAGSADGDSATTDELNTTGANGIYVVVSWDSSTAGSVGVTDSESNVWVPRTPVTIDTEFLTVCIFDCLRPTTGTTHTFTATGGSSNPTIAVAAFKSSPPEFDNESSSTVEDDSVLTTGTVISTSKFSIVITGIVTSDESGDDPAIDSDFTAVSIGGGAFNVSGGLAWKILPDFGAESPEWSWGDDSGAASTIAIYRAGDRVYEHANLIFRCVDPDDGTVSHEIDVKKDKNGKNYVEWAEWYSLVRRFEMTGIQCSGGTAVPVFTSFDHIQSFFNTPILIEEIIPTPPIPPPPP